MQSSPARASANSPQARVDEARPTWAREDTPADPGRDAPALGWIEPRTPRDSARGRARANSGGPCRLTGLMPNAAVAARVRGSTGTRCGFGAS
jgi:hypothetical protein